MNKFQSLKKELNDTPVKKLAIYLMSFVIIMLSFSVVVMAEPVFNTVTNYSDCVEAEGYVNGRTCIINGQEFTGPLRIHIPWSR